MGNESERMPVSRMHVTERPSDSSKRQALGDVRILVNVIPVIVAYEVAVKRLAEGQPDDYRQDKTDENGDEYLIFIQRRRTSNGMGRRLFPSLYLRSRSQEELENRTRNGRTRRQNGDVLL